MYRPSVALPSHYSLKHKKSINIPNKNLSQDTGHLLINPLLGTRQLDIHITVDAHETALVFCLAPFETDNDFFVDPVSRISTPLRIINTQFAISRPWSLVKRRRTGFAA